MCVTRRLSVMRCRPTFKHHSYSRANQWQINTQKPIFLRLVLISLIRFQDSFSYQNQARIILHVAHSTTKQRHRSLYRMKSSSITASDAVHMAMQSHSLWSMRENHSMMQSRELQDRFRLLIAHNQPSAQKRIHRSRQYGDH